MLALFFADGGLVIDDTDDLQSKYPGCGGPVGQKRDVVETRHTIRWTWRL
ncbi:MAG: hypothetical protein ACKV19_22605 [Verrucomicrobiales bacterium]